MQLFEFAKKIKNRIRNGSLFKYDMNYQRKYINKFSEPMDLIENSYYQYRCQIKKEPCYLKGAENFLSGIIIVPYYLKLAKKKKPFKSITKFINRALFITGNVDKNLIPSSLRNQYVDIIALEYDGVTCIDDKGMELINQLMRRYWYQPHFVLKCMVKIALYSSKVDTYNPSAIITSAEYSFTSSVLTEYCRCINIEHINIMHGEKIFDMHDAFFEFDRCFVWDEHYVKLFKDMRVSIKQFVIEKPKGLFFRDSWIQDKNQQFFITYYLGGENSHQLKKIREILQSIDICNDEICIRPHPRYSDIRKVKQIFRDFVVQDNQVITLEESLLLTKYVASAYSTVLYQAFINNKEIVVDNLSKEKLYKNLIDLNYIMLSRPHKLISEFY